MNSKDASFFFQKFAFIYLKDKVKKREMEEETERRISHPLSYYPNDYNNWRLGQVEAGNLAFL